MKISNYFYAVGAVPKEDRIELLEDRTKYCTTQYMKMFKDELASIKCEGRVAVLYASGVTMPLSEKRVSTGPSKNSLSHLETIIGLKETTAYMLHKYIGVLQKQNNITYANINSNTCASSMYSIYEAEGLLSRGVVDSVIIITEERTTTDTIRVFQEHGIAVTPGEGFACMVLTTTKEDQDITETKWAYSYNRNPFYVDEVGYEKVAASADNIKGHGTGTAQNTEAEKILGDDILEYKSKIGHTQGASALIELCMLLDDDSVHGSTLCVASGLGGFYGSCIVHKQ